MTQTVSLPKFPTDTEFEDFVAAHLQSAGFFIEKSVIDREEADVLELDIVFTGYKADEPPIEKLIEVKSGGWGFSDIFKLSGWGKYLGISDLHLVIAKTNNQLDFYKKKASDVGIDLILHSNDASDIHQSTLLRGVSVDQLDVSSWRYSYWVERVIQKILKQKKKSIQGKKSYICLDDYFHILNSGIFFSKNVVRRADKLYDAFKKYPNISRKVGNEIAGGDFDAVHKTIPSPIFTKTFFDCEFTDLTISTYVEHRARLAILKAAVDYSLFEKHGIDERITADIEISDLKFPLKNLLPETFLNGLEEIKKDDYFHLYPVFWQNFLWLFGGFILEDYKEQEYKILSMKTGIPASNINNALHAYNKLFPVPNGWFKVGDGNSNITTLNFMPVPFRGLGANYRKRIYTDDNNYDSLRLTGNHTKNNLIRWNNLTVSVLSDTT